MRSWIIYNSVIFVTMWSRLDINFHSFLNPASYESTPMYFIILKSSSYFYWEPKDYRSHFFKVKTYDFWRDEPYPERIFLSWSRRFISSWIRISSLLTWLAIIGSAWLISKAFKYSLYLSLIPDGGLRRLLFLNPVELFMLRNCYVFKLSKFY